MCVCVYSNSQGFVKGKCIIYKLWCIYGRGLGAGEKELITCSHKVKQEMNVYVAHCRVHQVRHSVSL